MGFFSDLSEKHEKLKKKIHSFRIPLSPRGRQFMGFVYFWIPIIGGIVLMNKVTEGTKKIEEEYNNKQNKIITNKELKGQNDALQDVLNRIKNEKI